MMRLTSLHIAFIVLLELTWTGQWMCYFGENAIFICHILPSFIDKNNGCSCSIFKYLDGAIFGQQDACGEKWFNKFYCSNSKTLGYFHLIISFIFSILKLDLEMQFFVWLKIKLMFNWISVNYVFVNFCDGSLMQIIDECFSLLLLMLQFSEK